MRGVAIVSPVRTAVGNFGGALRDVPAAELASTVIRAALERSGVDPAQVDDVILDRRTSKLRLVVVSHGGFLGIGGKPVAIEWRELEYDAGARLLRTRKLTADELAERQPYETDQSGVSIGDLN